MQFELVYKTQKNDTGYLYSSTFIYFTESMLKFNYIEQIVPPGGLINNNYTKFIHMIFRFLCITANFKYFNCSVWGIIVCITSFSYLPPVATLVAHHKCSHGFISTASLNLCKMRTC